MFFHRSDIDFPWILVVTFGKYRNATIEILYSLTYYVRNAAIGNLLLPLGARSMETAILSFSLFPPISARRTLIRNKTGPLQTSNLRRSFG